MFEFILPEPAAFLVESRLRALEAQLELPGPPTLEAPLPVEHGLEHSDITAGEFAALGRKFELSEFSDPRATMTVALRDPKADQAYFQDLAMPTKGVWITKSFKCDFQAKGYDVTSLRIDGNIQWSNVGLPSPVDPML